MKALLLINTALFVGVICYFSSGITVTIKLGSDSRSHGSDRTESLLDHRSDHQQLNVNTSSGTLLRLWSSDFHISPIADIKDLLRDSALVIDKSLSGHCHLTDTCERDLRVITKMNGRKRVGSLPPRQLMTH